MDPRPPQALSRSHLAILGLFFLISGGAALIYEVIWFRLLFLELGGTGLSIATVTAAFMAGLGLGAWLFGTRLALRMPPIRLYALLEAGIGLYALAVPALVDLMGVLDLAIFGGEADGTMLRLARYLLAGAVLLPPTICMGGTLPALARLVEREPHRPGRFIGLLYGLNTLGAVIGAAAAGFLLLPDLGFTMTVRLVAAANLSLAVLAFIVSRVAGESAAPAADSPALPVALPPSARPRLALLVYGASGVIAFTLQVSWSRILALTFASSVYAFTIILVVFLAGLGSGAITGSAFVDRLRSPRRALAWTFTTVGATALLGQGLFGHLPGLYLGAIIRSDSGLPLGWAATLAAALMLPATFALGVGFPIAVRLATGDARGGAAAHVGRLYAANTTGSVCGAFAAALLLIPLFGLSGVVSAAGLAALAVGLVLSGLRGPRERWFLGPVAAVVSVAALWLVVVPEWNPHLLSESVAFWRDRARLRGDAIWEDLAQVRDGEVNRLRFYKDGVTATVAVKEEVPEGGAPSRYLIVDGKVDASSIPDLPQQVLLAQLPLLARDSQDADVLVIGYATGITTGSILTHPVRSVVALEIESAVIEASRLFDETSGRPMDDPRVTIVDNDARAYLERTSREFDVISSSPSSPWLSGPSKLFNRETLLLMKARLRPGGVLCQYVQAYDLDEESVFVLLRTLQGVFEQVAVFEADKANLLILASSAPIRIDAGRLAAAWSNETIRNDLARARLLSAFALIERLVAEPEAVRAAIPPGEIMTDDNALIEYRGPQWAGLGIQREVLARLGRSSRGPAAILGGLAPEGPEDAGEAAVAALQVGAHRAAHSLALRRIEQGGSAEAFWVRGELLRMDDRRLAALEDFREALAMNSSAPLPLIARSVALQEVGRGSEAIAAIAEAIERLGEMPLLIAYRGLCRAEAGDFAGAARDLERAAREAGDRPLPLPVHLLLGDALETAGRRVEARAALETALLSLPEVGPPSPAAAAVRERLGGFLAAAGEAERAVELRRKAAGDRRVVLPPVLETALRRLEREGPPSARHYLQGLVRLDPPLGASLAEAAAGSQTPLPPGLVEIIHSISG